MELLQELRWVLVIAVSVSLFFPLNVPLAALAYKVQRGTRPLDLEPQEFWTRSTFAALGIAALSWAITFLDYYLVSSYFPADLVHLVLLLVLVPLGMWYFVWIFGFDDALEGVNVFGIYLGLPGILLALMLFLNIRFPLLMAESFIRATS